jgi:hypothetical protein
VDPQYIFSESTLNRLVLRLETDIELEVSFFAFYVSIRSFRPPIH